MDSTINLTPLYVEDPVKIKEKLGAYTCYKLRGSRVPKEVSRRFSDFVALREKFVEMWPGVFIPGLPHKKKVGSTDKEVIDMRIEMINRFCTKISLCGFLFNSDEIEIFIKDVPDVAKSLSKLRFKGYESLFNKYKSTFYDHNPDFDIEEGKRIKDKFHSTLSSNLPKLKKLRDSVKLIKERYEKGRNNTVQVIKLLEIYEKDYVKELVKNDNEKLVFYDSKKKDSVLKIKDLSNPFDKLLDSVIGDILDTEALIEAIGSLNDLIRTNEKIKKNIETIATKINSGQTEKGMLTKILSMGQEGESLPKEKERLENDSNCLENIITFALENLLTEIKLFKADNLEVYYKELSNLQKNIKNNILVEDDLWESILNDDNLKE